MSAFQIASPEEMQHQNVSLLTAGLHVTPAKRKLFRVSSALAYPAGESASGRALVSPHNAFDSLKFYSEATVTSAPTSNQPVKITVQGTRPQLQIRSLAGFARHGDSVQIHFVITRTL